MSDAERERRLADALADLLDGKPRSVPPELAPDLAALAQIDRAVEPSAPLPETLSGHRIAGEIGFGGMGRVLLAVDQALDRTVAIKILAERYAGDPELRARFMAEARATARLNHPNIVRIYSLGPAGEPPHFVMEYVEGAGIARAAAPLTWHQRAGLMRKVALAVEFLHERGILHRDLKPANILVGADLEPKLVDFGLALDLDARARLSRVGEVAGTPGYLSPEQAAGERQLDARSDVFSLGAVLYEMLAGQAPFQGPDTADLLRRIREEDPALPRRIDPAIPRDLQNICLKALEKEPARRYASAREMAADLRRYLAGEAVLAEPAAYARLMSGTVGEHLRDLDAWRGEQIISEGEHSGIRKRYERLLEREDAWIMAARRLTLPQVSLYLGAWILAVGAALVAFFPYPSLRGAPEVAAVWAAAAPAAWIGVRSWRRGNYRVAIAYLLACCLLAPVAVLVTLEEFRLLAGLTKGSAALELFYRLEAAKKATNAQLWGSLAAGLPVCWALRRFTRAPVFSLMLAAMAALCYLATLLRMGMLDCLDRDPGGFYLRLIPGAVLFLVAGYVFERCRKPDDSRYLYPFGVAFTWAALSGLAGFHKPYSDWLQSLAPWTRGQEEYLFLINALIYFALDRLADRFPSEQVRMVGKSFRFLIAGHVLVSLWLLGLSDAALPAERHRLEWLLVAAAAAFVFASIPRQMKNFFVSGMIFLAVGIYRVQQEVFPGRAFWPLLLVAVGLGLMLAATNYAALRVALGRVAGIRKG